MSQYVQKLKSAQTVKDAIPLLIALDGTIYYDLTGNTLENGITNDYFGFNGSFVPKLLTTEEYSAVEGKPGGPVSETTDDRGKRIGSL